MILHALVDDNSSEINTPLPELPNLKLLDQVIESLEIMNASMYTNVDLTADINLLQTLYSRLVRTDE